MTLEEYRIKCVMEILAPNIKIAAEWNVEIFRAWAIRILSGTERYPNFISEKEYKQALKKATQLFNKQQKYARNINKTTSR